MKLLLAPIAVGSFLMADIMSGSSGFGNAIAESRDKLFNQNAERIYAATNDSIGEASIKVITVRDHVEKLKTMLPIECAEGFVYLDRIHDINPSILAEPNKNIVITQKINRICELSITLDDSSNIDHHS